MFDTIKFDVRVYLNEEQLSQVNWTRTSTNKSKSNGNRVTVFHSIYNENEEGFPYICYTYKQDNPSQSWLKVEVAAPKFMYGDNIRELEETDIDKFMVKLREFLIHKLNFEEDDIPSLWEVEIEKLHLCKNFSVGKYKQNYLQVFSHANKKRHKKKVYYSEDHSNIESIYWTTDSSREKVYDKSAEVRGNRFSTSVAKESSIDLIRYEIELSNYELRKLSENRIAKEVLDTAALTATIQRFMNELGLSNCFSLKYVQAKVNNSEFLPQQKVKLMNFINLYMKNGAEFCKGHYGHSEYYRLKKMLSNLLEVSNFLITSEQLPRLA